MKKLVGIVLMFLFVLINGGKCYSIPIDSLMLVVKNMPDDTLKVIKLADLSKDFLTIKLDKSAQLAQEAVHLSKDLNYYYGYAYALKQMGLVYKYKSLYDSSLFYYKKSLVCFDSLRIESEKARLLTRMANVHRRLGKFEKSLNENLSALDIALTIKDTVLISAIYNNLGSWYNKNKEYDKALEYHLLNLSIIKTGNLKDDISTNLMNIGNVYKAKEEDEIALNYYKEALDLIPINVITYTKLQILHNIGAVYQKMGRFDEANNYYQKALLLEQEIGDRSLKIYTLQGVGNVLIYTGKFSEGEKYLIESFQLAEELGELQKQSIVAENLQFVYEKQKQYKNSLKYSKLHTELKDSILDLEKIKQITSLEQKYEAEKREHQIASLEKEQALQKLEITNKELENRKKSLQRNVLIIVIVFVLLIALYYRLDNKKRKKINVLLKKQNTKISYQRKEITLQNNKLLESNKTKDKLFQIIAHDLRSPLVSIDSLTQLIPYWVEEQDYKSLQKLSNTLEISVNNVLSLIDNLLNWALNEQGEFPYKPERLRLKDNILETIEVYRSIAEIKKIDLKFTILKDTMVFADKNMLFTVMRNLLNNAVKFTPEKGEIEVGIDYNQEFAKIWIKDTGVGIPKEKKELVFELASIDGKGTKGETGKGLGLFFCKEFVAMNNGDISIESDTGKGTTITFTVPLFDSEKN